MTPSITEALLQTARGTMTPNYDPPAFVLERGEGSYVWDKEGTRYLDFTTGIGVNALGHGHPAVTKAIAEQAAKLCHTSNMFHHEPYIRLCQRLCEITFGERVYLCNSGTEAVEGALKLARRYFHERKENRTEFVATHRSFHGRTYGAITLTGQSSYQEGFGPLLPGVHHVNFGDIDAVRAFVGAKTAAVIVEPIQGNGGVSLPPAGYLEALRELCDEAGCLLIFDEVQTGVARTGKWFAHQFHAVEPHIMTLAKALGGGLPLGAVVTTAEIAKVLQPGTHASTFGGNPVACAAGLATMDVIAGDDLMTNTRRIWDGFQKGLVDKHPAIAKVRGRGAMVGIQLEGRDTKALNAACRDRGLLGTLAGPNVLRFLPPLLASEQQVEEACGIIIDSLKTLS